MPGSDTQVSIPPTLVAAVEAAAAEEHRSPADVVSDALEVYLESRRWQLDAKRELARARELGLSEDDLPLTPEYRQSLREMIAQGLESARQGKLIDGETVFARIHAEIDELERQGHA